MIRTAVFSFTVFFSLLVCQIVEAQQRPTRPTGEFFQGLLKTYVESQLPTTNERANVQPAVAGQRPLSSPDIRRAGEMLTAASNEMSALVGALQNDFYRAQGVRQLLNLAYSVNADAAVLARQLSYTDDFDSLRPSLRKLDQDWRALAYRLGETRNLSASTLGHIQKIQQFADQLNSRFKVQPQVDLSAISQHASQMNQSLRTLLQDIRFEITDSSRADRLFSAGRNTYEQLQRFLQLTRRESNSENSFATMRNEFQRLEEDWASYQQILRPVDNRFIQRQVQLINDDVRGLNQLLYISSSQFDRQDLQYATGILQGDIDRLLSRINLKMLTELPAARRYAIEAASDLDQTTDDFAGLINDDLENIRDMYLYMYDEWQRLGLALQGISGQEARQAIRDVERSLADMKAMLGVQFDLDRNAASELASTLSGDARHLQDDIRDVFRRPNRYDRNFQTDCLRVAADFAGATRRVSEGLSRGEKLQSLAQHTGDLSTSWNRLAQMLPRFAAGDGTHLAKIQRQITPQVVRLQTLLTP